MICPDARNLLRLVVNAGSGCRKTTGCRQRLVLPLRPWSAVPETRVGNQRPQTSERGDTVRLVLIGYGRISTAEQNPAHQLDALVRAGVAERDVHIDTASGAKSSRPKLDLVLALLRADDTLVITRLDRLSRSVLHLVTLGAELRGRGVELKVTEQGIDTSTPEGRAMFGMLAVLAELQRELIIANTHDGLAAARARGRVGGRRSRLSPDQVEFAQQLYDARQKTVQQIADLFGVARGTVYGHLNTSTGRRRGADVDAAAA